MSAIFDALPGTEVPVGSISRRLAQLWAEAGAEGKPAIEADDAKATQINLVLHLGLNCTPEDAQAQFEVVVRFCRRTQVGLWSCARNSRIGPMPKFAQKSTANVFSANLGATNGASSLSC